VVCTLLEKKNKTGKTAVRPVKTIAFFVQSEHFESEALFEVSRTVRAVKHGGPVWA